MTTGYSGKPLKDKLGIRPQMKMRFLHAPEEYFAELGLENNLDDPETADFIHAFYTTREALEKDMPTLLQTLDKKGMLWVSWPKKSSKVSTNVTEQTLRDVLLPTGLVDVKVCAVTDVWSGLKFVWRKELR